MSFYRKHHHYVDGYLNLSHKFEDKENSIKDLFKQRISHTGFSYNKNGLSSGGHIIDKTEYNLNSLGYRSREFLKDRPGDLITIGCSTSFGQGVPENEVWSSKLSNIKSMDVVNLSIPGMGATRYIEDLSIYIKEFGKPKNIIALIPDLFRLRFLNDFEFHISSNGAANSDKDLYMEDIFLNAGFEKRSRYIEIPFMSSDRISPVYVLYRNISAILMMESLFKSANINFFWSTYDSSTLSIINDLIKIGIVFDGYIQDEEFDLNEKDINNRCKDSHQNLNYGTENWDRGLDFPNNGRFHQGIHFHTHVAELFDKKLGKDEDGNLYKI